MRRFLKPRFSILFCLISILCLSVLLATVINRIQGIKNDALRLKKIDPTFPEKIDWSLENCWPGEQVKSHHSTAFIGEGVMEYRLDQVDDSTAWLSRLAGYRTNYRITNLSIDSTDFSSDELKIISRITSLKKLALRWTVSVDNKALEILGEMKQLDELLVECDGITNEEISLLKKALPNCDVHDDSYESPFSSYPFSD